MFAKGSDVSFGKNVDVYSLSANLYYMITGSWPHRIPGEDTMGYEERQDRYKDEHRKGNVDYPESISPEIKKILQKGLSPNPNKRYANMNLFLRDLLSAYNGL